MSVPPEDCQDIKLPRIQRAFEQVEAELRLFLSSVLHQSLYASRFFLRGKIECLRLIRCVGEEDEAVRGNDNSDDPVENENPPPHTMLAKTREVLQTRLTMPPIRYFHPYPQS